VGWSDKVKSGSKRFGLGGRIRFRWDGQKRLSVVG